MNLINIDSIVLVVGLLSFQMFLGLIVLKRRRKSTIYRRLRLNNRKIYRLGRICLGVFTFCLTLFSGSLVFQPLNSFGLLIWSFTAITSMQIFWWNLTYNSKEDPFSPLFAYLMDKTVVSQNHSQHLSVQPIKKPIQDLQYQQKTQTNLYDKEFESATILRAIPDSMLRMTEDGICLSYIPSKEASSFVIKGEVVNRHVTEFLAPEIALQFIKSAQLSLRSGSTKFYRFPIPIENGGRRYYEARISAIGMTEVLIMVRQLSDLDQAYLNSTKLSDSQNEDTILLLSEPELAEILERTLEKIQQNNQNHVLCCLVIDELNIENDSEVDPKLQSGSRVSEILMYQIAAKVKTHLSSNYIARLGDNELVTLVLNSSLDRASTLVDKLRDDVNNFSFHWKGNEYPVSASIGLLEINAESLNTTADLINAAKATCNIAKQKIEGYTFWVS